MRAIGVSPFAEVHPREDSRVAGDARVSGTAKAGRREGGARGRGKKSRNKLPAVSHISLPFKQSLS